MKLERLHEHLTTVTAVIIGGVVSYWFGLLAGEGSVGTILALIGGFCLTGLLLALRKNVWVLVPLAWPLGSQLPLVAYHPALHDVVTGAVLATTFMMMAVKAIRVKPRLDTVSFWLWATLLYLLVTWVRHPTGGLVLNSDRIGGRAYINTGIACAAFFILSRAAIPKGWNLKAALFIYVACNVLPGVIAAVMALSPRLGTRISMYYGGVDPSVEQAPDPSGERPERLSYMLAISYPILQWMIVVFRPLSLMSPFYPGRLFFFVVCLLATLLGGFRSILLILAGLILIASYLRRGPLEVMRLAVLGVGAVVTLSLSSYVVRWPLSIQRALSILPGHWDEVAVAEAEHSTQWRIYMWRMMLTTDRYIENKWLGDGFGFTMRQFQMMNTAAGALQSQENYLIVGEVHSGPITAIRYVGYAGLALYLCLQISMAREAFRLCRVTMRTELGALTWIICLPIIWEPVSYVFVFGSYDSSLPTQIFWAGMLRMLRRSVDIRKEEPAPQGLPEPDIGLPTLLGGVRRPMTVPLP